MPSLTLFLNLGNAATSNEWAQCADFVTCFKCRAFSGCIADNCLAQHVKGYSNDPKYILPLENDCAVRISFFRTVKVFLFSREDFSTLQNFIEPEWMYS